MTPLESIREGILTGNMELVCAGYNRLSPEPVSMPSRRLPPDPPGRRENYREPQDSYGQYDEFERHTQDYSDTNPAGDDQKEKTYCRPEPFVPRKRINMFADEGDRPAEYTQEDQRADAAARQKRQAPRRDPYVPLAINCDGCGKRFNVNPVLAVGGVYRCDRCSNKRR